MKKIVLLFISVILLGACNNTKATQPEPETTQPTQAPTASPVSQSGTPSTSQSTASPDNNDTNDLFGTEAEIEVGL